MIPAHVEEFRTTWRARELGPRYSGWGHLALTTLGSLAAIAVAASRVASPTAQEWAALPLSFLFANVVEYGAHRGPMHHPWPPLRILFERHTRQHHRFYTHDAMEAESSADFKMVLFPPVMLVFFLGGLAGPIAALLGWLVSPNVGWIFFATGVAYFLSYEWLHWAYHAPARSWIARLPLLATLRRHHQTHHDQELMQRWNFNITFPIADALFATTHRAAGERRSLAGTTLLLVVVGATLGAALDRAHVAVGAIAYPEPVLFGLAWWVPLLYATAVPLIGVTHVLADRTLGGARAHPTRLRVSVGLALLGTAWVASGLLPSPWAAGAGLGVLAVVGWFALDRTWQGVVLALTTAIGGVLAEIALSRAGLFHYRKPEVMGVATWLPWIYVLASVAVGNLGRAISAAPPGASSPTA